MQGRTLWQKALSLIPGGNCLYSKRPERFSDNWPIYYSCCHGCEVWDLDGKHYYDFSSMGIGCCTLGYGDFDVEKAVRQAISFGSMCTLNCPEEVELAEKLLELHPWADMVKFARTGGEACAIADRIARVYSGIEDYHGWLLANTDRNIVTIADEVTTGFRVNIGGLHLVQGTKMPDIAVFGKALGNGYPIAAVIGTKEVMMAAEETFISSTYFSERIGFVAGLATLKKMQKINSPEILIRNGERITDGVNANFHDLRPILTTNFSKEFISEMVNRGYLVGPTLYTTVAHTDEIIDKFIETANEVLS